MDGSVVLGVAFLLSEHVYVCVCVRACVCVPPWTSVVAIQYWLVFFMLRSPERRRFFGIMISQVDVCSKDSLFLLTLFCPVVKKANALSPKAKSLTLLDFFVPVQQDRRWLE